MASMGEVADKHMEHVKMLIKNIKADHESDKETKLISRFTDVLETKLISLGTPPGQMPASFCNVFTPQSNSKMPRTNLRDQMNDARNSRSRSKRRSHSRGRNPNSGGGSGSGSSSRRNSHQQQEQDDASDATEDDEPVHSQEDDGSTSADEDEVRNAQTILREHKRKKEAMKRKAKKKEAAKKKGKRKKKTSNKY